MLKKHKSSLSGSTILGSETGEKEKGREKNRGFATKIEEYSDEDEDVGPQKEGEPWKPAFLRRHESRKSSGTHPEAMNMPRLSSELHSPTPAYSAPPGAVPATPSLLNAMNRVALAQNQALGGGDRALSPPPRLSYGGVTPPSDQWKGFWSDVKDRASS